MATTVICDYCGKPARFCLSGRLLGAGFEACDKRAVWYCSDCTAWVYVETRSPVMKPDGRMATAELHDLQRRVHMLLCPLWHSRYNGGDPTAPGHPKHIAQRLAFSDIADRIGKPRLLGAPQNYSEDECRRVIALFEQREVGISA